MESKRVFFVAQVMRSNGGDEPRNGSELPSPHPQALKLRACA